MAAINAFIDELGSSGLVVCCRLMEYRWLPQRLKLNGAICLESLSSKEVNEFLVGGGSQLAGLQQALSTDPVLQELSQTPLMLSIMSLAYKGSGGEELAERKANTPEERRKEIFGLYVERMFQRKESAALLFPKDKVIGWLSWLATKMKEHSQSVLMIEGLQPSWLGSIGQRILFRVLVALIIGLLFGLAAGLTEGRDWLLDGLLVGLAISAGCWSASALKNGVFSALVGGLIGGFGVISGLIDQGGSGAIDILVGVLAGGLIGGLIGGIGVGSLDHILSVETMSWKWKQFWKKTIPGSILGVIFGLMVGLIDGLTQGEILGTMLFVGLGLGLIFGLVGGLLGGLISGLLGGMTDTVKVDKASQNEGIKLSGLNAAVAFVTSGLIFGLSSGLIFGLFQGLTEAVSSALAFGLLVGWFGGG